MDAIEDGVHHARRLGRGFDAVDALAGIAQPVGHVLAQQVRQRPQVEHGVCELYVVSETQTTPKLRKHAPWRISHLSQPLQYIRVLLLVVMRKTCAALAHLDRKAAFGVS